MLEKPVIYSKNCCSHMFTDLFEKMTSEYFYKMMSFCVSHMCVYYPTTCLRNDQRPHTDYLCAYMVCDVVITLIP